MLSLFDLFHGKNPHIGYIGENFYLLWKRETENAVAIFAGTNRIVIAKDKNDLSKVQKKLPNSDEVEIVTVFGYVGKDAAGMHAYLEAESPSTQKESKKLYFLTEKDLQEGTFCMSRTSVCISEAVASSFQSLSSRAVA